MSPMNPRLLKPTASGLNFANLVLVYDTSLEPADLQISVPLNGTVNCLIDWGDGTSDSYTTTGFKTHTYASAGIYTVQVKGTMTTLSYGFGAATTSNKRKLRRCLSFGNNVTAISSAFYACDRLIECPKRLPASVTNLSNVFALASQFNDPNVSDWDVSAVTNMQAMFNITPLNQSLASWNTSNVTNMSEMFRFASSFNRDISMWDVSQVTTMANMFNFNTGFNNGGVSLNAWNTGNVTNMSSMFSGANGFSRDISGWDMKNVTNLTGFMSGTNWTRANYDAALIAWSAQTLKPNVTAGFGDNKYSAGAATTARDVLTGAPNNWTITDGGQF